MTQDKKDHDLQIDDLVLSASEREADESAIFSAVNNKLDASPRSWFRLPSIGANTAVAGFAVMMLAAGFVGYNLPDIAIGSTEDGLLLLAMGEPSLIDGFPSVLTGIDQ
ncbi:MAG: hypothetical protein AAGG72_07660 [Pseudomonadota bacterium]